jgi:lipoprotein NlpI
MGTDKQRVLGTLAAAAVLAAGQAGGQAPADPISPTKPAPPGGAEALLAPGEAAALVDLDEAIAGAPGDPGLYQRRGVMRLFAGDPAGAVEDFDRFLAARPEEAPHHWQRGIALYYAGRYADGAKQFQDHDSVNPRDVENAAWLFLCQARATSTGDARENLLPYRGDPRVPMAEIHRLFAGQGSAEDVIEAAGDDPNQLCYAHLYLALYHEALGQPDTSLAHAKPAATQFKQPHFMGRIAQIHLALRTQVPEDPRNSLDTNVEQKSTSKTPTGNP